MICRPDNNLTSIVRWLDPSKTPTTSELDFQTFDIRPVALGPTYRQALGETRPELVDCEQCHRLFGPYLGEREVVITRQWSAGCRTASPDDCGVSGHSIPVDSIIDPVVVGDESESINRQVLVLVAVIDDDGASPTAAAVIGLDATAGRQLWIHDLDPVGDSIEVVVDEQSEPQRPSRVLIRANSAAVAALDPTTGLLRSD